MSSNMRLKRVCQHCNKIFTAKTSVTKFCSDECAKANYKVRQRKQKIETSNEETRNVIISSGIKLKQVEQISAPIEKELVNISYLIQATGISRASFYRLMEDEEFPKLKVRGKRLFSKTAVIEFLQTKYGDI